MPLFKTIKIDSETQLRIWNITESYADLLESVTLKPVHLERVLQMKSHWHKRGFLSVRHLLKTFGYEDADLFYDAQGRPHLNDGKQISITHSLHFSGVIVGRQSVGIDIEKQRPKIERIAQKFIDYESIYLNEKTRDYLRQLTIIWCVKESLYKLFATPGLSFKQHCLVIPFAMNDSKTRAWIDYKNQKTPYKAHFLEFEGFTCAYVIHHKL